MEPLVMFGWLAFFFLVSKGVNYFSRRPAMNPWSWFAGSYAVGYLLRLVAGVVRGSPGLADSALSYLPITITAIAIGVNEAPKWRAMQASVWTSQSASASSVENCQASTKDES